MRQRFPTKREARRELSRAKLDVAGGCLRHFPGRTVSDLAGEWLEAVGPNPKSTTLANYTMLTKGLHPPVDRRQTPRLADPAEIQKLDGELRRRGGQPQSQPASP